jgi:hypothetical protein
MQSLVVLASSLVLGFTPLATADDGSGGAEPQNSYQGTLQLVPSATQVRLHDAAGSTVSGEGSVQTPLPGEGHLLLRVPYVLGESAAIGDSELSANYETSEGKALPKVGLSALLDLPTAPGARGAHPGLKATAVKKFNQGLVESVHVESELRTEGLNLDPHYRTAVGTTLRLGSGTSGSVDFIEQEAVHPLAVANAPSERFLAQVGLKRKLDASTGLHVGLDAGLGADPHPLRAVIGIDRRF